MDKSVKRKYIALVHGNIPHDYGTIDAPIGRNKNDRQSMAVVDDGKEAVTHFNVLEHFKDYTLVDVKARNRMYASNPCAHEIYWLPISCDPKYGPKKTLDIGGQSLTCWTYWIRHRVQVNILKNMLNYHKTLKIY